MMWPMRPLAELCLLAVDCVNKTAPVVDGPTPYKMIRTTNVKRGFIDVETVRYVSEVTFENWTRRSRPQYGDVILTREAPVGEVGRYTASDAEQIFLGQRLFQYRPNPDLLYWNYLAFVLQSPLLQNKLHGMSFGATVPHIKVGDAENLQIPYPPLNVQRTIGKTLAAYDDLVETNRRRIALLEESARLLYQDLVSNCDEGGNLLPGCQRTSLKKICDQIKEPVDPGRIAPDTPYLSMEHMTSKSISLGAWETAGKVSSSKLQFQSKDVLFGRIRPYFHKVGIAQTNGITSTDMIVVRARTVELLPLVALTMSAEKFVAHAVVTSNGTKMPRADWKVLKDWELVIPTSAMLSQFAARVMPIFELLEVLSSQNRQLTIAREALIPKLMSGEIQV
jgi:type I restriction enzyme S subunit